MKTITIRMCDLIATKQEEIKMLYPFDDKPDETDIVTFVQVYDREDLDLDIEKARIEKEFNNPEIH